MPTRYLVSSDGIEFSKPEKKYLLKGTGCCHNFFPFYDTNPSSKDNEIYKAVGGTQWKKKDPYWKNSKYRMRNKSGINDPARFHGYRGLYSYMSKDGINWKSSSPNPMINKFHEGFITRRKQGREFDSHNSIFYHKELNRYILYVRSNLARGIRHIQYTTSNDLKTWSKFKMINIQFDKNKDNLYFPNFFPHPTKKDKYIGIIPFTKKCPKHKKDLSCIKMYESYDAIKWNFITNLDYGSPWYLSGRQEPRNRDHPVSNCIISNDGTEIYLYIHHNYFNNDKNRKVKVIRYSIPIDSF